MQNKNLTDYQYVEMLYELCFNRTGDPGGINNSGYHFETASTCVDFNTGDVL